MLLSSTHLLVLSGSCSFRAYPFNGSVCPLLKFFHFIKAFISLLPECLDVLLVHCNPFLMYFNLQGSRDVPCSSFLTEVFNFIHLRCILSFKFAQPRKVLWFHSFVKEAICFTSSLSRLFSLVVVECCNTPRPLCQVSSGVSLLLPCLLLACCILPCHHVHCIIMFSKLASVPVSQFLPLSVLTPDTLARARGTSEILFYKWPENVLGMG